MSSVPSPQSMPASYRRLICAILALALAFGMAAFLRPARAAQPTADAVPVAETDPMGGAGVATSPPAHDSDDAAIWVDPSDATKSVIIGSDKVSPGGGIEIYDLTGHMLHRYADGSTEGIDIRPVTLAGKSVDVAAASGSGALRFYTIDPVTRALTKGKVIQAGKNSGALCMYHSPVSPFKTYAFADIDGKMGQWELTDNSGQVDAHLVRGPWDVGTTVGGCVADDDLKALYVSEEQVAIWKYGAEPADSTVTRTAVDTPVTATPPGHVTPAIKGLALVRLASGTGYLIASSTGDNSFAVYDRAGANAFIRSFHVVSGPVADKCDKSTGIEAAVGSFGPTLSGGLFLCQDLANQDTGKATKSNPNFKLVSLADIVDLAGPVVDTTTTTVPSVTATTAPITTVPTSRSGYWMVGADGKVYPFGDAKPLGDATTLMGAGAQAVDLEPTPSFNGYWILDSKGAVHPIGDAAKIGDANLASLAAGEQVTSLSATPSGNGYWIFTTKGRALPFGDAKFYGDMSAIKLNGPVLDSVATPSGLGYYMVASDGGIFAFGDAKFYGSMGGTKLNAPVQSLVPDSDGVGYWLVASDGGIFAFESPFRGSTGNIRLNKPVKGMVRFGNGYLMVATDGGIFNFSDKQFYGSLGDHPPAQPIVAVAAVDAR